MSIGVGIFLIAAGAILAFGIRDSSSAVNLTVVGVVIMLAGAAGIWLSYHLTNQKRRVRNNAIDPAVEEEYRLVEDGTGADPQHDDTRMVETREQRVATDRTTPAAAAPAADRTTPTAAPAADPATVDGQPTDQAKAKERRIDLDPQANGLPERPIRRARR